MDQEHRWRVHGVAAQVRQHYRRKRPFRVFHGSTNSTRILSFKRSEMVDVSNLNHVLSIDTVKRTAVVEPNVPMDQLLAHTLRYGLLPLVVTEFPGITVGGGIQGGAGESSSFKWGFLSQTINWQESVLADGRIITSSSAAYPDLFYGSAGSLGTIGITTAVELQLMPATDYAQVTYFPVTSFKNAREVMQRCVKSDQDFVDGIMFGADHGLIITGKLTNIKNARLRRFSRAYDPWYYIHAEKIDKAGQQVTETVPLRDYLFRYDRGAFWMGRFAFTRFGVPFNRVTRFLLDPLLHTRKLYQALQVSGVSQEHIIQDLTLPLDTAENLMEYLDEVTSIYPLWLCPIKPEPRSPLLCNGLDTPLAINIGVWGGQMSSYEEFLRLNKLLEAKLSFLGGKKWLYAHCYYTEREFWQIYDKQWYTELRTKYEAGDLPNVYDKVRVRERYGIHSRRSIFKTILGRANLRLED